MLESVSFDFRSKPISARSTVYKSNTLESIAELNEFDRWRSQIPHQRDPANLTP